MFARSLPWLLLLEACHAAPSASPGPAPAPPANEPIAEAPAPAVDATVTSWRAKKSTTVRSRPDEKSAPVGVLAQDMRVTWRGAAAGPGCARWIEIEPFGFVCEDALQPTRQPPLAVELPRLDPGSLVPGIYGVPTGRAAKKARLLAMNGRLPQFGALSMLLKFRDEVTIRGRSYYRTRLGQLFDAREVRVREASAFSGIELPGRGVILPLAWAQSRTSPRSPIAVWSDPDDGDLVGLLDPRAAVPVLGQTDDGLWAHVGPDAWISVDDLHIARRVEPPSEVSGSERWVDVDLAEQVLVAYEGRRPVFTTLVSTGAAHPTPLGTYRIWVKFSEADMQGEARGHRYAVSSVPWTMYFYKDFALHAAYWHDGFGEARSNGCVNLAPQDARRLYHWTAPAVPTGWSMSYSTPELAGSLIQVRRSESPFNDLPPLPPRKPSLLKALSRMAVARAH
jgi:hypothetical protein